MYQKKHLCIVTKVVLGETFVEVAKSWGGILLVLEDWCRGLMEEGWDRKSDRGWRLGD